MCLQMFEALLPYFGCKRDLVPYMFKLISYHIPRERWQNMTFVDAFMGSGAVGLYAKAHGFKIICNDSAERSYLAGKALIENNDTQVTDSDIHRLFAPIESMAYSRFIESNYVPDVFPKKHAQFLDRAFINANSHLLRYLLVKYIFHIRPYSKFSSPNAFNRPFEEGQYDRIKSTYRRHIKDNLSPPLNIINRQQQRVNCGIFSNGKTNEVHKKDVFEFVKETSGDILYLDPPYAGTLAYESEYEPIDMILGDYRRPPSVFSSKNGMDKLEDLLAEAGHYPYWVISFGNAGGRNKLNELREIVSSFRTNEAIEISYAHCEAMASDEHKENSKEWMIIAGDINPRPSGQSEQLQP